AVIIVICYLGPDGEHHWSKHYPFCGGTFQSPIDIQTQLLRFDPTLRPIELQNYNLSANEQLTLGNNGHSIQLSLPRRMYLSSLPHRYTAAQLHFHWGSEHLPVGSEHTVNGRQFAAEMHMVLFNSDKYPNISVAADKSDGLAVLGVLIEVGEFNPAFAQFLKYINGIKYKDQRVQVPAFNIRSLLPVLLDEYYRYDGSLTTPPCYPSVLWTVFKNPVTISLKQFLALATAIYSSHQQESAPVAMNSNYRKPQYTDNRVVLCSFQGGEYGATLLPHYYHSTTTVLLEYYHSATTAIPQHYYSTTTAIPQYYHGTTTVLVQYYNSTTTVLVLPQY
uniref:Carbonic anhydrase n=1 Tax=Oncorhynchus kisutch TaxID=8019 RepID=A0A8C7G0I2_ONCKI